RHGRRERLHSVERPDERAGGGGSRRGRGDPGRAQAGQSQGRGKPAWSNGDHATSFRVGHFGFDASMRRYPKPGGPRGPPLRSGIARAHTPPTRVTDVRKRRFTSPAEILRLPEPLRTSAGRPGAFGPATAAEGQPAPAALSLQASPVLYQAACSGEPC